MRKRCYGVAPYSYSGSVSHMMIRARAKLVTLLDGIIPEESSKSRPDPRPIFPTAPVSNESTTPNLILFIIAC
jgi:hypothetical protein